MIHSMTGYAIASAESARGALHLELRSVNSRFLDLQFRVADELRATEPLLRELISARIARGKLDCRLYVSNSVAAPRQRLNAQAIEQLRVLAAEAAKEFPGAAPLRVSDVLRWPGVLAEAAFDEDSLKATLKTLAGRVLDELCAARAREGAKLAAIVLERGAEMRRR